MTTRDDIAAAILVALAAEEDADAAQPEPPKWRYIEHRDWQEARQYGSLWRPSLLGELADTEARRVRCLRVLYALRDAGLVAPCRTEGGRLWRVKLTPEGRAAVAALTAAPAAEGVQP